MKKITQNGQFFICQNSCSTSCGIGQTYRYRDCVGEKCNHLQVTSCFMRSCTPNKRDFNRFGPLYQYN